MDRRLGQRWGRKGRTFLIVCAVIGGWFVMRFGGLVVGGVINPAIRSVLVFCHETQSHIARGTLTADMAREFQSVVRMLSGW